MKNFWVSSQCVGWRMVGDLDGGQLAAAVSISHGVSLLPAGARSLQRHRSHAVSLSLGPVCQWRGLPRPRHVTALQRPQARPWLVCPPVAEDRPQQLQRQHHFRVWHEPLSTDDLLLSPPVFWHPRSELSESSRRWRWRSRCQTRCDWLHPWGCVAMQPEGEEF